MSLIRKENWLTCLNDIHLHTLARCPFGRNVEHTARASCGQLSRAVLASRRRIPSKPKRRFLDSEDAENSASTPENTHRFLTDPSISPVLEVANDEVDSADNNDNIEVIKNEPIEPIAAGDNLMNCSGDNFHRLFRPHFTDISQLAVATSYNQV